MLGDATRGMGREPKHDGPPADDDIRMVVRALGELSYEVHVGERSSEVAAVHLLHQHIAISAPGQAPSGERRVDIGRSEHIGQGCVISSGRTASSNCSPVR